MDRLERDGAEKIVLGPLDQAGVAQLAADVLQAQPGRALLKMAERAGGSPFLLVELLSGLREEQLVRVESGRAELVESRLPHRVSESMRLRLERMSDSGAAGRDGRRCPGPEVFARVTWRRCWMSHRQSCWFRSRS